MALVDQNEECCYIKPVGYVQSLFSFKNGTPRQSGICPFARGTITISKDVFNNPQHSLEGLEKFSHIWIIFIFHKNNNAYVKAKVKPPRLDGARVGLFATRSPYRPNAIGLTLAKLDKVENATLHISGIDLLDGTPVIDIKPYIPHYDMPIGDSHCASPMISLEDHSSVHNAEESSTCDMKAVCREEALVGKGTENLHFTSCGHLDTELRNDKQIMNNLCRPSESYEEVISDGTENSKSNQSKNVEKNSEVVNGAKSADWVKEAPASPLNVRFTHSAETQLQQFSKNAKDLNFSFMFLNSVDEARMAIISILHEDPRSVYRRKNCQDSLYYFAVDSLHVTCWFDEDFVEVLRIKPVKLVERCQKNK